MTISHGVRLYFPKEELLAISKTKSINTLEHVSPIVFGKFRNAQFEDPISVLNFV